MLSAFSRRRPPSNEVSSVPRLPDTLPSPVVLDLDPTLIKLLRARGSQSLSDSYAGIPLMKLPEDLRAYEHLLWSGSVSVVVELGAFAGGSALWFRDRLRTLAHYGHIRDPQVIAVDIDVERARTFLGAADAHYADTITLISGDVCDPQIAAHVSSLVAPGASVLVVDDSGHTYESTTAALTGYSHLVQPEGFFIVEDGGVDIEGLRQDPSWPQGVLPAIRDWLETSDGQRFTTRRDLEIYGVTNVLQGFLQRRG